MASAAFVFSCFFIVALSAAEHQRPAYSPEPREKVPSRQVNATLIIPAGSNSKVDVQDGWCWPWSDDYKYGSTMCFYGTWFGARSTTIQLRAYSTNNDKFHVDAGVTCNAINSCPSAGFYSIDTWYPSNNEISRSAAYNFGYSGCTGEVIFECQNLVQSCYVEVDLTICNY